MSQSKRELREQRRAERVAAERAAAVATTRRRRFSILGGAAVAAIAVVAIAATVSARPHKPVTATPTNALVAGIPEHNGVLGNPNAPYTVTEYLDLQCPICKQASTQILPTLIN